MRFNPLKFAFPSKSRLSRIKGSSIRTRFNDSFFIGYGNPANNAWEFILSLNPFEPRVITLGLFDYATLGIPLILSYLLAKLPEINTIPKLIIPFYVTLLVFLGIANLTFTSIPRIIFSSFITFISVPTILFTHLAVKLNKNIALEKEKVMNTSGWGYVTNIGCSLKTSYQTLNEAFKNDVDLTRLKVHNTALPNNFQLSDNKVARPLMGVNYLFFEEGTLFIQRTYKHRTFIETVESCIQDPLTESENDCLESIRSCLVKH